MTIKESNEQLNAKLDYVIERFDKFTDKQEQENKQINTNKNDIKYIKKIPAIFAYIASFLSCISIILIIIKEVVK